MSSTTSSLFSTTSRVSSATSSLLFSWHPVYNNNNMFLSLNVSAYWPSECKRVLTASCPLIVFSLYKAPGNENIKVVVILSLVYFMASCLGYVEDNEIWESSGSSENYNIVVSISTLARVADNEISMMTAVSKQHQFFVVLQRAMNRNIREIFEQFSLGAKLPAWLTH